MRWNNLDLVLCVIVAIGALIFVLVPIESGPIRMLLSVPFVLIMPGYAMSTAIFTARQTGIVERILYSIGLSVIIVIIGGFALHWTAWGLLPMTWTILLGSITCGATAVAWIRRRVAPANGEQRFHLSLNPSQMIMLGVATMIVVGALGLSRTPAPAAGIQGYSILWLLPSEHDKNVVRLGVTSGELVKERYRLELVQDGSVLHEWPLIELKPGEHWETAVSLHTDPSDQRVIETLLYRLSEPNTVYRQVILK